MKKGILIATLLAIALPLHANEQHASNTIFAEALLWKLREGSADNWAQEIPPSGTTQTVNVLRVPFKWSPGVRLGIRHSKCHQCWDTTFSFTGFKTKGTDQAAVSSGGIYSPFLGNFFINNANGANFGPNYYNAGINWKVNFNIFDLEFGRTFAVNQTLQIRSFVGLKGGFINQKINSTWQNPTVATTFDYATEDLKNNFIGLGPAIGIDTTWSLSNTAKHSFNIFGNFSGALMFGHWNFKDLYQNNTPASDTVTVNNINGAASMARGLLGIEWLFNHNLRVRIGYETQVWFNQMQFYSLNMGRLNNLMSLQGGVLSICYQF